VKQSRAELFKSKKVVLREIKIKTGIQAGELNHPRRVQIDIIYLAM